MFYSRAIAVLIAALTVVSIHPAFATESAGAAETATAVAGADQTMILSNDVVEKPVIKEAGVLHKGFRVGVAIPKYQAHNNDPAFTGDHEFYEPDYNHRSTTLEGDSNAAFALSAGYSRIPIQSVGFATNITATSFGSKHSDNDKTSEIYGSFDITELHLRAEANTTYAFSDRWYANAGLNVGQYTIDPVLSEMDPMIGFQLGANYKAFESVEFQLSYISMRNKGYITEDTWFASKNTILELRGLNLGASMLF